MMFLHTGNKTAVRQMSQFNKSQTSLKDFNMILHYSLMNLDFDKKKLSYYLPPPVTTFSQLLTIRVTDSSLGWAREGH